jgi:WD40 repeat protein
MSSADGGEERLLELLAAGDEVLAAGTVPEALSRLSVPGGLRPRLQHDLAFLQRLRHTLGQPGASGPAPPPAGSPDALPGRPLLTSLGRFQIRQELGRGSFGVVLLAHDPLLGRAVALKVPRAEVLLTSELRERFRREARAAAALEHPHLVPVYEVGEAGAACFLVSAYCPGSNLAQWLRQRTEPVPFAQAASLLATVAEAVQHAHDRGVIHRDLKPSNILLDTEGQPHVTDFGLARFLDGLAEDEPGRYPTRTGIIVGTAPYMAPEQAGGKSRLVGPAADVYGLGAILYELLTGRAPFQGESELDTLQQVQSADPVPPSRLRLRCPRDLEVICLKCLEKDPGRRYASAGALAEDLRRFLAGEPIRARPVGTAERLWRRCRRNPVLSLAWGLAGAAVLAVVALSVGFAVHESWVNQRLSEAAVSLRHEEEQAESARAAAQQQYLVAERRSALMALDQGLALCEQGRIPHGMLWLARGLEIAAKLPPADGGDIERTARANLACWAREAAPLCQQFPQGTGCRSVAFSPDGGLLYAPGPLGDVQAWETATGTPVGARFPPYPPGAVALSRDGRTLATGGTDRKARLWEVVTGKPLGKPLPHRGAVYGLAFSPDGRYLLTGSDDFKAQLWEVATGKPFGPPLVHPGTVWGVAYSPDGRTLLTACGDGTARLWAAATGKPVGEPLAHQDLVWAVAFSPDGETALTGSSDGTAQVWDLATRKRRGPPLRHQDAVEAVAYSPDGRMVATGSEDRTVRLWETATGRPVAAPLPFTGAVNCVAFTPDGRFLYTNSGQLWQLPAGPLRGPVLPHEAPVRAVAYSPDGRTIATGDEGGKVRCWDAVGGQAVGPTFRHQQRALAVVFSPDGRLLLSVGADHTARRWDLAGGTPAGPPLKHPANVHDAAFSPDGRSFVTGCKDGVARWWDTATGRLLGEFREVGGRSVDGVAFSPDGRTVLVGCADHTARLWEPATGSRVGGPFQHPAGVSCVAFGPGGHTILTGCTDGQARLWRVDTRQFVGPPLAHQATIGFVAFSLDGHILATCSNDRTARLWDAGTHRPIGPALRHEQEVTAVTFHPNGRAVLTGSRDRTARVWPLPEPVAGEAERVRRWAEVFTGMELDEHDVIHGLNAPTWRERRARNEQEGGPPIP